MTSDEQTRLELIAGALLDLSGDWRNVSMDDRALALAFSAGIKVRDENGESCTPVVWPPDIIAPDTRRFTEKKQALQDGRLTFTPSHVTKYLVAMAEENRAAHDACAMLVHHCKPDLPPELLDWALSNPSRPRKGARKRERDWAIQYAVYWLAETEGLSPTRNDESDAISACDVVGSVLSLSHDAIKKVWNKRPPPK